jgi:hypothetical protein
MILSDVAKGLFLHSFIQSALSILHITIIPPLYLALIYFFIVIQFQYWRESETITIQNKFEILILLANNWQHCF